MTPVRSGLGWMLIGCLLVSAPVLAQQDAEGDSTVLRVSSWPLGSRGSLKFFVDAAGFRGTQGYALQEFYTLLDGKQLQFVPEAGLVR